MAKMLLSLHFFRAVLSSRRIVQLGLELQQERHFKIGEEDKIYLYM